MSLLFGIYKTEKRRGPPPSTPGAAASLLTTGRGEGTCGKATGKICLPLTTGPWLKGLNSARQEAPQMPNSFEEKPVGWSFLNPSFYFYFFSEPFLISNSVDPSPAPFSLCCFGCEIIVKAGHQRKASDTKSRNMPPMRRDYFRSKEMGTKTEATHFRVPHTAKSNCPPTNISTNCQSGWGGRTLSHGMFWCSAIVTVRADTVKPFTVFRTHSCPRPLQTIIKEYKYK